jgi:hypothetical protein
MDPFYNPATTQSQYKSGYIILILVPNNPEIIYAAIMARIARVILPSYPHHVTRLGVRSLPVSFRDGFFHAPREQHYPYTALGYVENNTMCFKW